VVQNIAPVRQFEHNNYAGKVTLHNEQIAGHHSMTDTYSQQQNFMQCMEYNTDYTEAFIDKTELNSLQLL
jgi:hypothetical protein